MKKMKIILALVLSLVLVILIAQNTGPVTVRFLWLSVQAPAILLIIITALCGAGLGLLSALFLGRNSGSK